MLGQLEEDADAAWTWIIADADWEVRSDAFPKKDQASEDFHPTPRHVTPRLATPRLTTPRLASPRLASPHHEDLQRLQSGLFPDWHDPSKRHDRVLYLQKLSLQHRQYSCIQAHPVHPFQCNTLRSMKTTKADYSCRARFCLSCFKENAAAHGRLSAHRVSNIKIKKGMFRAAAAWRSVYGQSVLHAAKKAGGGEVLMYRLVGWQRDDHRLVGWQRDDEHGYESFIGPNGEICNSLDEAYANETLSFLERFLIVASDTKDEILTPGGNAEDASAESTTSRVTVTTSSLEDWLWRGDHPLVRDMSLTVYSMWVYRVEKPAPSIKPDQALSPRYVQVPFSDDYKCYHSHEQRIATELRVPLFEGFTMPPSYQDSETAAMYKQLLTRPLSITPASASKDLEDIRLVSAFLPLCTVDGEDVEDRSVVATKCFTKTWLTFRKEQTELASEGRKRFLDRFENPSLWETCEM